MITTIIIIITVSVVSIDAIVSAADVAALVVITGNTNTVFTQY